MSILLAEKREGQWAAALMHRGGLYAYLRQDSAVSLLEEQIYSGIVDRAIKGVSAVFVRLPGKEYGFLPLEKGESLPSGAKVTVQVRRPPNGTKKALLSRDITLAGTHVVYLPFGSGVHLSSRLKESDKEALLEKYGAPAPEIGGMILRSEALSCDPDALRQELNTLEERWQAIQEQARKASAPRLLWEEGSPIAHLIREEGSRLEHVLTNAPDELPERPTCPVRYSERPFQLYNVEHKLDRSLRRTVTLKSGANLVIDPCEAMTVIDVNSAMAAGGRSIAETAEKVNREAAWEIARLLRLRGIGGMILIDFIDLPDAAARERLMNEMRNALLEDPVKTTVHDFTALGILELTRHRGQTPLPPRPDEICPCCGGSGVKTPKEEDAPDA